MVDGERKQHLGSDVPIQIVRWRGGWAPRYLQLQQRELSASPACWRKEEKTSYGQRGGRNMVQNRISEFELVVAVASALVVASRSFPLNAK